MGVVIKTRKLKDGYQIELIRWGRGKNAEYSIRPYRTIAGRLHEGGEVFGRYTPGRFGERVEEAARREFDEVDAPLVHQLSVGLRNLAPLRKERIVDRVDDLLR